MTKCIVLAADLHNIGDLIVLQQCAHGLREQLGIRHISVRQWNGLPNDIAAQLEVGGIGVLRGKNLARSAMAAFGAMVLVGGGNAVRDNDSIYALSTFAAMAEVARRSGGGSAIIGAGAGALTRRWHRWLWRRIITGSRLVAMRDRSSATAVADICGGAVRPVVTADLVFLPSPLHDALRPRDLAASTILVAPCIDSTESRHLDVAALAASAIDAAAALGVDRVVLAAHDSRPDKDPLICAALVAAIRGRAPHLAIDLLAGSVVAAYTDAYAATGLVITNRLHAVIFALLARKPVVVLDDGTPKTLAVAERFDVPLHPARERISPALLDQVVAEAARGASAERTAALEQARRESRENFALLRAALPIRRRGPVRATAVGPLKDP